MHGHGRYSGGATCLNPPSSSLIGPILIAWTIASGLLGHSQLVAADATPTVAKPRQLHKVGPGPWGNLEYYVTSLKPPESLGDRLLWPQKPTEWYFPGLLPPQCKEKLLATGIPAADLTWVDRFEESQLAGGRTTLFPPDHFLTKLSKEQRGKVAALLRTWRDNRVYWDPFIVVDGTPEDWFAGEGISTATTKLAASLCYARGTMTVFSDVPLVIASIAKPEERRAFTRVLNKQAAIVLRMRMGKGSDPATVMNYWSSEHRRADVLSILEGVTDSGEVELLDISHLLPPLARKLLYTFPGPSARAAGELRDCHWTSLNFFEENPGKENVDLAGFVLALKEGYASVKQPLQFGDILVLSHAETNEVLHSAVVIAENIVFTENGGHEGRPWVLMKFSDMAAIYVTEGKLAASFFRRK